MSAVVEEQIKKARGILAEAIPLSKYIQDNRLGRADESSGNLLCPVHDENTPSFRYDDVKKTCHCFGCGVKGTVVELHYRIQQKGNDRYTIVRSIKELSTEYEVEIPDLYERTIEEKVGRVKSRRRRGVGGKRNEWIYREKLVIMEGKFRNMSTKNRIKISGLMDDMWMEKVTAREVYKSINKIIKEEQDRMREG